MARQPDWTHGEWALLVDLVVRYEGDVPEGEVEHAHHVLRATALTSENPTWRRRAADPSFRSLGGVWTQYYLVRRTRSPEQRRRAPRRLREIWVRFDRDALSVTSQAEQLRERVSSEDNPYRVTDDAALRLFLTDIVALLDEIVELARALPMSRASPELITAHAAAWTDLKERDLLSLVLDEIERPEATVSLENVGLTGVQLGFKLTGWLGALTEWRRARTADSLRRAFRWANVMLGSLGQALAGPGLDIFKEFKEGTEAVLAEAFPPGGYLPAPA